MGRGNGSVIVFGNWYVNRQGRQPDPSAGIIDARSVRGAPTVTSMTWGYDAGKKISGRKVFGLVDTIGLLVAVTVVVASMSDNVGGVAVVAAGKPKCGGLKLVWVDGGFKKAFGTYCRARHVGVEVVNRIHPHEFVVLPRRWVVERTWSWLMANRRLQIDYERDPEVTEGFIWAAHSRLLLHRLTESVR